MSCILQRNKYRLEWLFSVTVTIFFFRNNFIEARFLGKTQRPLITYTLQRLYIYFRQVGILVFSYCSYSGDFTSIFPMLYPQLKKQRNFQSTVEFYWIVILNLLSYLQRIFHSYHLLFLGKFNLRYNSRFQNMFYCYRKLLLKDKKNKTIFTFFRIINSRTFLITKIILNN